MQVSEFKNVSVGQYITIATATDKYSGKFKRVIRYMNNIRLHYDWVEIEREEGKHQQIPTINILTIS